MKKIFGLVLALCSVGNAADVFHHEVLQYPKGDSCAQRAIELGAQLERVGNVSIYFAGVIKEQKSVCDIKISYIADKKIDFINTLDSSGLGVYHSGIKATEEECNVELSREVELFRKYTGREEWVAYCLRNDSLSDKLPWSPVVEGVGPGKLKFYSSSAIASLTPNDSWETVFKDAWKIASLNGTGLVSVVGRNYLGAGDKEIGIRFYAAERLFLRFDGVAEHNDPLICEQQIEKVRSELLQAKHKPLAVFCGKYADKKYRLGVFVLSKELFDLGNIRAIEDPKTFASLDVCRDELPRIVEFYKTKLNKAILSGMCSNAKNDYQVTLFEEKL